MFEKMNKRRLMELAGIDTSKLQGFDDNEDSDAGLHGEHPTGGSDETTEEHLEKETKVFQDVHDALERLLDFLHSQEGFEEKRGKEDEYSEMEHDATDLRDTMKKHLSGYDENEGGEDHDEDGEDIRMVRPAEQKSKMSFR